jgi:flagellar basal-body rod protein FlgB
MPDSVNFSGGDRFIKAALSGLAARQRTIANNVANIDTPNFKASEVRFEDTLRTALSRGNSTIAPSDAALQAGVKRTTMMDGTSSRGDGNNVDIEREMEMLAEANLMYSALTQTMSSRIGIMRSVINGR